MAAKLLQLVTIGNAPPLIIRELADPLLGPIGLSAQLGKLTLQTPTYAFNKDRNQYNSVAILRRLVPLIEKGQSFVIGVLDVDLFVPDAPFVLGEADRESKAAVFSLFRLKEGATPEVLRRRVQLVGSHLAANLMGLSFCEDGRCLMFPATTVQEVDRKSLGLCNLCRNELAKVLKQG